MADDFIDGAEGIDQFDPADLEQAELKAKKDLEGIDDLAKRWIERRRLAYAHVFTPGKRNQGDIDIVLCDLMYFCKVWVPTYNVADGQHADVLSRMKEGRREVFQRIKDFSRLDSDALMLKYTDATTK